MTYIKGIEEFSRPTTHSLALFSKLATSYRRQKRCRYEEVILFHFFISVLRDPGLCPQTQENEATRYQSLFFVIKEFSRFKACCHRMLLISEALFFMSMGLPMDSIRQILDAVSSTGIP